MKVNEGNVSGFYTFIPLSDNMQNIRDIAHVVFSKLAHLYRRSPVIFKVYTGTLNNALIDSLLVWSNFSSLFKNLAIRYLQLYGKTVIVRDMVARA